MKNDNAHSLRLVESLRLHAGEDTAEEFERLHPLSKSADYLKKFEWTKEACSFLEERFDGERIEAIRRDCHCNDGRSNAEKMRKYLNRAESVREFAELFDRSETFASLEYISERELRFCYPQCYCSCVKRVPKQVSGTWCLCTLGNAEGMFRELFGDTVKVSLLESIKTGGERCVISVSR